MLKGCRPLDEDEEIVYQRDGRRLAEDGEPVASNADNIRCPIVTCDQTKVAKKKGAAVRTLWVDRQFDRVDRDLVTGEETGIDWRLDRCVRGSKKTHTCLETQHEIDPEARDVRLKDANASNKPKPEPQDPHAKWMAKKRAEKKTKEKKTKTNEYTTCKWPDRLWHRMPYAFESQLFAGSGRKAAMAKYTKCFDSAANGKDVCNLGGDFIGDGPGSAHLDYDLFLDRMAEQRGSGVTEELITKRQDIRRKFWHELQMYLDKFKTFEEQWRLQWDIHMAYFIQVINPMVEESIYINEVLNQMRNYLKAVSDWSDNPTNPKWDPWNTQSARANLGEPLTTDREMDAESPSYDGYASDLFVRSKGATSSYFDELGTSGKDRLLSTSMLELIRREALADGSGPEKFKVLFGSFVRTDKPNGDPDCGGALQSLQFAQLLTDSMGRSRRNYLSELTGQ
jgi:hypothetical protein